jgi:hypothetical protein
MATPEEEPRLKLTLSSGGEFYATRDNTTLFQFFGRLAIYDHVFIETGMEDSTPTGIYLFQLRHLPTLTQQLCCLVL